MYKNYLKIILCFTLCFIFSSGWGVSVEEMELEYVFEGEVTQVTSLDRRIMWGANNEETEWYHVYQSSYDIVVDETHTYYLVFGHWYPEKEEGKPLLTRDELSPLLTREELHSFMTPGGRVRVEARCYLSKCLETTYKYTIIRLIDPETGDCHLCTLKGKGFYWRNPPAPLEN